MNRWFLYDTAAWCGVVHFDPPHINRNALSMWHSGFKLWKGVNSADTLFSLLRKATKSNFIITKQLIILFQTGIVTAYKPAFIPSVQFDHLGLTVTLVLNGSIE